MPVRHGEPRILHLISSSGVFGAEQILLELAVQSRSAGRDVAVGVFENSHNPNLDVAEIARSRGLEVQIFPCRGRFDRNMAEMIRHYVHAKGVNILHSHNDKSNFYAWLALSGNGARWVVTSHGRRAGLKVSLYRILNNLVMRRADSIVAVSDSIARELELAGVAKEKISVFDNGIDIERFGGGGLPLGIRHLLGISADSLVIGTVGALTKEKGHRYLLAAANNVIARFPHAVFLVVGDGRERKKLESLSVRLGICNHVAFAGMRNDIPEILASLDVFVLPSLKEGMPMALLEAQAARVPTIASAVGAIPKIIEDGFTGTLVQPGDPESLASAVVHVLSEKGKFLEMAQRGFERVRDKFSSQAMAEKYHKLYSELLAL